MNYLVFRLYGPMASWGEIAVGEARHTANYPSKSAISGLLAAALGIERGEDARHQAIADQYHQAVKLLGAGQLLKDYHTAQAPDSVGKFRYRTRRDELVVGKDRLGTVLSSREYRTDAHALVCLRAMASAPYTLDALRAALREPLFHLYLGRKSCPLAAPLDPQLIEADSFKAALDGYVIKPLLDDKQQLAGDRRWLAPDALARYYWEGSVGAFTGSAEGFALEQLQTLIRHDKTLSRQRWQFSPRNEYFWQDSGKSNNEKEAG